MVKVRDKNCAQGSPLLSRYVSWHFSSMNYENPKPISLLFYALCHFLVPFWGDLCSTVVYTCLSKLFFLLCFYNFWNRKLTAIILPVFTRKAFSKKELLIIKCFNSEKEAKIHAQKTVDKNAHSKRTKWVPTAVADWVFFWERSRFKPKCTSFQEVSPQEVALIVFAQSLETYNFYLKNQVSMFSSIFFFLFPFHFKK